MDAFKDRLSQRARDTSHPALAHQSLGRTLNEGEHALASALMEIMGAGQSDFSAVAKELTARGIVAPLSGGAAWTEQSLNAELAALNADLDAAYMDHGYGA